jgi:hypothetical protein
VNRVSVALSLALVLVIAALCAENRDLSGNQKATLKLLDTTLARNAERAVGWKKGNDSLRRVIASHRSRPPVTIRDTVEQYVYLVDSVIPRCEVCAARLDSAVLAARAEREAATLLLKSKDTQINWLIAHDKPHHSLRTKLRERVGLTVGYGVTSAGGQVYVGPQVGLSLRLIP